MRARVLQGLSAQGMDPVAVENRASPGTPDVNHLHGWLELKYLPRWRESLEDVHRVESFTSQQRLWHARRAQAGGRTHVLLQVRRLHWVLLEGAAASVILGKVPTEYLLRNAVCVWLNGMDWAELAELLS